MTAEQFTYHSVLGDGAFGTVYLATDYMRGEPVALKMVRKTNIAHKYLPVENRILRLTHGCPFLVHGYAAFHNSSHAFFIMELARGGTLSDLVCTNKGLDTQVVRHIMMEMICGIQFLHAMGVIHRDLKLDNVLLTGDGHVKIADFGIAVENVFGRADTYGKSGKLGYMAPEILLGGCYNEGVDWFALGVIIYEMLHNCSPFRGGELSDNIKHTTITREPDYREDLQQEELDLLKGLLSKDPSQRLGVHGDIRGHPYFSSIQWAELEAARIPLPLEHVRLLEDAIDKLLQEKLSVPHNTESPKTPTRPGLTEFDFVCPVWADDYYIDPGSSTGPSGMFILSLSAILLCVFVLVFMFIPWKI